jgi:catechol 2,3-dioxygenase-like lactoylglutathione lyase family enzyme
MEIEGIDRVVIGVKDLDRGMEFFSKLLEVDFIEVTGPLAEAGGVRFAVNLEQHIELISPVYPLKDANPPNPKKLAKLLDAQGDGALFALAFKVKDAAEAAADLERKGISVLTTLEAEGVEPFTKSKFTEVFVKEEDMFGVGMGFCEYEPMKKPMESTSTVQGKGRIEGVERVLLAVKDMDKAIALFSKLFDVDFVEITTGPIKESALARVAIRFDKQVELISPIYPLKEVNPPDPITMAKRIEEQGEGALYALVLKVEDDAYAAIPATEMKGIRVAAKLELDTCDPYPISNYKEVVLSEEDTLDVKIAYASYEVTGKE